MAENVDADLISRLREESERTKDDPYPPDSQGERSNHG